MHFNEDVQKQTKIISHYFSRIDRSVRRKQIRIIVLTEGLIAGWNSRIGI